MFNDLKILEDHWSYWQERSTASKLTIHLTILTDPVKNIEDLEENLQESC